MSESLRGAKAVRHDASDEWGVSGSKGKRDGGKISIF